MKKIPILTNEDCQSLAYWFETSDGKKMKLPWQWNTKVDLDNMTYIEESDINYKSCKKPTLNELGELGLVSQKFGYKEYCLDFEYFRSDFIFLKLDVKEVIDYFKEEGVNVTAEAILHNFDAWMGDMKSGYRDSENGYHLFTPCGCNPLSFRVTTLHKACEDWQKTYIC